jgi:hypothetical protein
MNMKVTGYQIREAIRKHELSRDTAAKLFKKSQHVFEGDEEKAHPKDIMNAFTGAELAVVSLQEAQQRYNLAVTVDVQGEKMTLCSAVKRLGGAGRVEKMWRDAVCEKEDRYGYNDRERQEGTIVAKRVVPHRDAIEAANKAAGFAGALRAAVAMGNSTVVEVEDLDGALFT